MFRIGLQQLIRRNVKRFRGGLVFKAHRLVYHSTLGLRVIQLKKEKIGLPQAPPPAAWSYPVSGFGIRVLVSD